MLAVNRENSNLHFKDKMPTVKDFQISTSRRKKIRASLNQMRHCFNVSLGHSVKDECLPMKRSEGSCNKTPIQNSEVELPL